MRCMLAATAFLLLVCSGCATAINGRYESVPVDSFPRGADIEVACGSSPQHPGVTPATVKLERRASECRLILSKHGYDPQEIVFEKQTSRATQMNKVIGFPVGLIAAIGLGVLIPDAIMPAEDTMGAGFEAGTQLGAAPANQVDKHLGGAYKWVPGDLYVVLIRSAKASSEAPDHPQW